MKVLDRLAKWLIFSVLLALLPLAYNYLHVLTRTGSPTLEVLLGKGELLLVAASISAAAVGSLIGGTKNWLMAKIFAGGGSVLLLGLASLYYVDITAPASGEILKVAVIAKTSLLFFGFSVISGAGCVALEEE
jgi:hypothetical protein